MTSDAQRLSGRIRDEIEDIDLRLGVLTSRRVWYTMSHGSYPQCLLSGPYLHFITGWYPCKVLLRCIVWNSGCITPDESVL